MTTVTAPEQPRSAGWIARAGASIRSPRGCYVVGALASVAVAVALYTRFSINGTLNRDEAIYAYGGQRLAHGTPPYVSIFDPKTPLATMLAGVGAAVGRLVGSDQLELIRLVFFGCAVLTVLAIYVLVHRLTGSVLGALAAAAVFVSYTGFAQDALSGPDAKTPGVLCAVVSLWFAARRQWFWSAFVGALAFLVWQPLAVYPAVSVVAAAMCTERGRRWRSAAWAVGGAVLPVVCTLVYFAVAGALHDFVESALRFPIVGVERPPETLGHRLHSIAHVVIHYYGFSGVLFWAGLVLLVALIVFRLTRPAVGKRWQDPIVLVVGLSLLGEAGYACTDFQSYPDLYPLLPYPAVGIGVAAALALERLRRPAVVRLIAALAGAAALILVALSWSWFETARPNKHGLPAQRATACAIKLAIVPGTTLVSLGDPVPLVLTGRQNPDRYIYLGSGVAAWKVKHTRGGLAGWADQIRRANASIVITQDWGTELRPALGQLLQRDGYRVGYLGQWRAFMTPAARARAMAAGLAITHVPFKRPLRVDGGEFTEENCGNR